MSLEDREDVRDMLAGKVKDALSKCTMEQVAFFHRLYPGGVDKIETTRLPCALDQCERTIKKNAIRALEELNEDQS